MVILLALIPAICWGSIGLVSGKLGGNSYQQTLGMTWVPCYLVFLASSTFIHITA